MNDGEHTLADSPKEGLGGFGEAGSIEPSALESKGRLLTPEPVRTDRPVEGTQPVRNSENEATA
jgi:hypothetical protein